MTYYMIHFSNNAKRDLRNIVNYISNVLIEPDIAIKVFNEIMFNIYKLSYLGVSFRILDIKGIKENGIRKFVVKNYLVFYTVDKDKKIVDIKRIIYGKTYWLDIL